MHACVYFPEIVPPHLQTHVQQLGKKKNKRKEVMITLNLQIIFIISGARQRLHLIMAGRGHVDISILIDDVILKVFSFLTLQDRGRAARYLFTIFFIQIQSF